MNAVPECGQWQIIQLDLSSVCLTFCGLSPRGKNGGRMVSDLSRGCRSPTKNAILRNYRKWAGMGSDAGTSMPFRAF
jgi:hypothetical protein